MMSSSSEFSAASDEVQVGDMLHSSSTSYMVLDFKGEGCFGKIVDSLNLRTEKKMAVKILKDTEFDEDIQQEVFILKVIGELDSGRNNIIKFYEQFQHMEKTCLVFERLDMDLYDMVMKRRCKHLALHEIRPVAKQLFVALDFLKDHGVLHTDIKPDNVMLVNMQDQPLKVKLIDFGCAMIVPQIELGMEIQPYGYRAPEISLGLPFSEAIDVWGVGCTLAFLYLGRNPFPVYCKYQMMKSMVAVLGQPKDHLLRAGKYSQLFFIEEEAEDASSWRLMTAEEFTVVNDMRPVETNNQQSPSSLNSLIHIRAKLEAAEMEDHMAFVSILEELLHLDGDERISPRQALQQPFISMSHLRKVVDSGDYLTTSETAMRVCHTEDRVHYPASDSSDSDTKLSGSRYDVSWLSVGVDDSSYEIYWNPDEALASTEATRLSVGVDDSSDDIYWNPDEALASTDASRLSVGVDDRSDEVSWYSDEAPASAGATRLPVGVNDSSDEASWYSDEAPASASATRLSVGVDESSDEVSWYSDEAPASASATRLSVGVDESTDEVSWYSDEAPASAGATRLSVGVEDSSDEVSWYSDEAPASADATRLSVGVEDSNDEVSWYSDEAPASAGATRLSVGVDGSMDEVSWYSDEAPASAGATRLSVGVDDSMDEVSWYSDEAPASAGATRLSVGVDDSSDEVSWYSDEAPASAGATRLSVGVEDSNDEVSWYSDEAPASAGATRLSVGVDDSSDEVSCYSAEAVDVAVPAKASSGRKRKLLRRIKKFFSSLKRRFFSKVNFD
ncbi:uncharacterized protein [Paralichthys olivaceus]|uniref:uncharacterized protein isoform X2 n=1 Tax=Paralichthys olivaceus TaxID=8255 RepID=UPI003752FCB5